MLKIISLIGISLGVVLGTNAQSQSDVQLPKIVPPSPDAAALGKYGQIPIDKSSGVPEISIPLYQINTPRFILPISLSYHAAGIKVEEIPSWVGAGWSLNAGGLITRTIKGLADDCLYGFLNNEIKKAADIQWPNDKDYIADVLEHKIDTDPDDFFFNFNNHAGSFVFDRDKKPTMTPYKPIKIKFDAASKNFDVTDEAGNLYKFHSQEYVTSSISTYMSGVSTWYLSQMISADLSDTINFIYTADATEEIDFSYNFSQDISEHNGASAYQLQPMVKTSSWRLFHPLRISSILFKGGKIDFVGKSGRLDEANVSLESVIISSLNPATNEYSQIKSFKLLTDYFYSTLSIPTNFLISVSEADKHRLKLNGLQESDANSVVIKTHQFDYNTTMLPQIHSFAQDKWGYFNGEVMNQTLLESRNVVIALPASDPVLVTIGSNGQTNEGADRHLSPIFAQAGVLTKITYPTNGYTVFSYESNKQTGPEMIAGRFSASAIGMHVENVTISFTPTDEMLGTGGNIFHIRLTKGDGSNVPLPSVKIVRVSDGAVMYSLSADATGLIDKYVVMQLSAVAYQLVAVAQGGTSVTSSNPPFAIISTDCDVPSGSNLINVGGLRVTSIKTYNKDGVIAKSETYKYGSYGNKESGGGDVLSLIPLSYHSVHSNSYAFLIYTCCNGAANSAGSTIKPVETYSNNSFYPITTTSGSPVAYSWVTVFQGDPVVNIGKSVYNYNVYKDSILITFSASYNGIKPIPVTWKNGEPIWEGHYKNNNDENNPYSLIEETSQLYENIGRTGGSGTTLNYVAEPVGYAFKSPYINSLNGQVYTSISSEGQQGALKWSQYDFYWYDYPISTGTRVLKQTSTKKFGPDGISNAETTTNYYYDNLEHVLPTRAETSTSTNDIRIKKIYYPQDMVDAGKDPTGIYNSMVGANMISPAIETWDFKNTLQISKVTNNYAVFNTSLIEPQSIKIQNQSNLAETRLQYINYDNAGNLCTVTKDNGVKVSYQWGYNGLFPNAMAINSSNNNIFHEGFEDGNGNTAQQDSKTGHLSHTGSYTRTLTSLDNGNYYLRYWQKSAGAWNLLRTIINVTGNSYNISLNGQVDDICFYPFNVQFTTYTYDPLIGKTSETDPAGKTTYYEYDGFNRLKNIKDYQGNIVKNFQYNYASGCGDNCVVLPMQTMNGSNTIGYPVGVFNVNGQLLGKATNQGDYVNLWNNNAANQAKGALSAGTDALHFNLTLATNQTAPTAVTGLRYYQFDLPYTQIDGIRSTNGEYVDFGDGTSMRLGADDKDVSMPIPANTIVRYFANRTTPSQPTSSAYFVHSYPDNTIKTITIYHNDDSKVMSLDNSLTPATSLTMVQNLSGNMPQFATRLTGSSLQVASYWSVTNILNWSSITGIEFFGFNKGDGVTVCKNINFSQDFMVNNKGLKKILFCDGTPYASHLEDATFKVSRLKTDWNTYFTNLEYISIRDDQWDRENISGLLKLNAFGLMATNQNHTNDATNNPVIPLPASVINNVLMQIASGSAQTVSNGVIYISSPGSDRTGTSDAAVLYLKTKGWTITINGVNL